MRPDSRSFSILSGAILLAWVAAVHHDLWFGLAEIAHKHSHSHSHSHHHFDHEPHGDDHDDDGEEDVPTPILPDIHSTHFVSSGVSLSVAGAAPAGECADPAGIWVEDLDLRGVDCANAPPPDWLLFTEKGAATLLLMAHCVQSNAPPSMV